MQTDSFKEFKRQYENKNIVPPDEKTFSDQFNEKQDISQVFDNEATIRPVTDIVKLNEEITNLNVFKQYMQSRGYVESSNRFFTKNFAESDDPNNIYSVNITINDGIVTAITAYDKNNKVTKMPDTIISIVKDDIHNAITSFI